MKDDRFIDLRTLPPELLRPIQPWVDAHLAASRYERHFEWRSLQFTIERGPLIRASELTAVFARFTNLAAAAEQAAKQQVAQIEAETGLAVAKGHANSLKEQLMRAAAAQAAADQQLTKARAEIESLKRKLADLQANYQRTEQLLIERARQAISDCDSATAQTRRVIAEKERISQRLAEITRDRDSSGVAKPLPPSNPNPAPYNPNWREEMNARSERERRARYLTGDPMPSLRK